MSKATSRSAGWQPATYYPDPAIHALDPRFEKYWLKLSAVERLATGLRWAEGPVWFGDGRYLLCSDIPNNRIIKWEEETGTITVLMDSFEGKRLNSPNDVVVKSDGSIWFTDPMFGLLGNYEGYKASS